jgi:hypothetical protein
MGRKRFVMHEAATMEAAADPGLVFEMVNALQRTSALKAARWVFA